MQQKSGMSSVWVLRLVFAILLGAITLVAAQGPTALPDGPGKALLTDRCGACHGLEGITGQKMDRTGWANLVESMKGMGANLKDEETTVLLDYLVANYGVNNDAETKKLLADTCGSCHGLDLLDGLNLKKDEWNDVVNRMVAKGADLTEKQTPVIVDYLARFYGPKK
jgi:mono/diheme cytochrome c family protein